jgi:hypothetical protein
MSDPRILGATTHKTLIGDKTWTTESDQGGQGQEQALDRQGVQEFFFFRPHCCLFFVFLSFPYLTPFDRLLDESNWTSSEEVLDSSSTTQHILFLSVRLCHGFSFFVHSFQPSLRCSYSDCNTGLSFVRQYPNFSPFVPRLENVM